MKRIIICLIIFIITFSAYSCKRQTHEKDAYVDTPAADGIELSEEKQEVAADEFDGQENVDKEPNLQQTIPQKEDNDDSSILNDQQSDANTSVQTSSETEVLKVDFEGLPYGGPIEIMSGTVNKAHTLEEYFDKVPSDNMIVKGVKKDQSTQYITKSGSIYENWYSETPIEVTEVYSGNINKGDSIIVFEKAVVVEWGGKDCIMRADDIPVIEKGKEYIFLLSKYDYYSTDEKAVYSFYDKGFEITDKIKNAKSADEAGLTGFDKEVFDTYYYK